MDLDLDLSIIIVNWNTRDLLQGCLESLNQACPGLAFEVLVVDNNSADGSAAMVEREFPEFRLIPSGGNLGFSRGNNLAFDQTSGDFVLLLNPDTICPVKSLTRLVEWSRQQKNLGAASPLLTDSEAEPTITFGFFPRPHFHWLGLIDPARILPGSWLQRRVVCIPQREAPSARVDYIAGACFLIPRPALERIGTLDEQFFMYFEETDWCWRAHQAGLEIWYCNQTEVVHLEGRAAEKASTFSTCQFQKSYRRFVEKNYGPHRIWQFRLAQFCEYGLKGLLRSVVPWNRERNRNLARTFLLRAKLQLANNISVEIPGNKPAR